MRTKFGVYVISLQIILRGMQSSVSGIDFSTPCVVSLSKSPSVNDLFITQTSLLCDLYFQRKSNGDNDETPIDYGKSFGEPQFLTGDDEISARDIIERIAETQKYMDELKKSGSVDPKILKSCRNIDGDCSYWR